MHSQRHTYRPDQPLTAWVYAIARYKMIDLLRVKALRDALHVPIREDMALYADCAMAVSDARRDLAALLATLPDRHRLPIVHVKIEGLSVAETARLIGMSESAVKIGIHRGVKALAQKVKDLC